MSAAGSSTVSVCGLNERINGRVLINLITKMHCRSVFVWLFSILIFCLSFKMSVFLLQLSKCCCEPEKLPVKSSVLSSEVFLVTPTDCVLLLL